MRSLHRGEIALSYEICGAGPPVVLLHGWCCDRSFMTPLFVHFLAKHHSVVAVDLRGHGWSDKPGGSYSIEMFADDLGALCAELGLEKPILVGHSMGGMIVFELAVQHPALASAVVMIDAPVAMSLSVCNSLRGLLDGLRGPDYRRELQAYARKVFFAETDDRRQKGRPPIKNVTNAAACRGFRVRRHDRDDPAATNARVTCPCLFIGVDDLHPRSDLSAVARIRAGLNLPPYSWHGALLPASRARPSYRYHR